MCLLCMAATQEPLGRTEEVFKSVLCTPLLNECVVRARSVIRLVSTHQPLEPEAS